MDTTLIEHERRLTRLEDQITVSLQDISTRLQKLEESANQAQVNAEQERRREMATLNQQLDEARRALDSYKSDAVVRDLQVK
jgi:hypothetical protein